MSAIMEIIYERETQKTLKDRRKKTKTKENKEKRSYSKTVRAKWYCWVFKLGFLQLICQAFWAFKSNLELALSIILKETELYESKHVVVEFRCLVQLERFQHILNKS